MRNQKITSDVYDNEINGNANIIVVDAAVVVGVVAVAIVFVLIVVGLFVVIASITLPGWKCYIRCGPKGDNTARKGDSPRLTLRTDKDSVAGR